MDFGFIVQQALLGLGLAMDAFSVSLANGLNEVHMKKRKLFLISGTFGFFQALMPMLGWVCVHTIVEYFKAFEKFIPWIALALLGFIGGKMLFEGIMNNDEVPAKTLTFGGLLVQGVATSIDALSVGFTIAEYNWITALVSSLIIAAVTFIVCSFAEIRRAPCGQSNNLRRRHSYRNRYRNLYYRRVFLTLFLFPRHRFNRKLN